MTTFACDVSYFQVGVDDTYPHQWFIFRVCDGTFRDPKFLSNLAWAEHAALKGKITGYTIYCVYRPGVDVLSVVKNMVGSPSKHLTVMVDVESWGGQIGGDHSDAINKLVNGLAAWLGSRKRVLAYGNQGDLAGLYPRRPSWLRLVVATYGSQQPSIPNMIGWQYSDGQDQWPVPNGYPRSSKPFGRCDHNVFPGLTPQQLASALGVAPAVVPVPAKPATPTDPVTPPKPKPAPKPKPKPGPRLYTIKPGDTLGAIAAGNHITLQRLYRLNILRHPRLRQNANNLRIGWKVRVR